MPLNFPPEEDLPVAVPLLRPSDVIDLVARLTDAETHDLVACIADADDPLDYCARVTDWFQRRAQVRRPS
jgi:hypothetical protein